MTAVTENPLAEGLERLPVRPTALVIFGATGDLAHRKLLPALYNLAHEGALPERFELVAVSRSHHADEEFQAIARESVQRFSRTKPDPAVLDGLLAEMRYIPGLFDDDSVYGDLGRALDELDDKAGYPLSRVFYLATAPQFFPIIIGELGKAGLNATAEGGASRVVIEKPFGYDLASARGLNAEVLEVFDESQVFRIDHYLGKETVQNLMAFRFANALFEPVWNRNYVDHVQITAAEDIGIEGRAGYYEGAGALRDLVQNHMLQLLALLTMEPPTAFEANRLRDEKLKVLEAIVPPDLASVPTMAMRAQYGPGGQGGVRVRGYREEDGVAPDSRTETYAALRLRISNWRWAGVPFYLRTGKRLASKSSEIVIQFRAVPHSIFGGDDLQANRLIIRLQPEEEIALSLMNKTPSLEGVQLRPVDLNLSLTDAFKSQAPRRRIAYERLILEAIKNNQTLFVRRDEAEAAWIWVDAIIEGWGKHGVKPLPYPAGSWGPAGAFGLIERSGHSWHDE